MQHPKLHIVSFDVPYPADYGGAIDVFYKIKSLSEAGCKIYLHCFQYGRGSSEKLNEYCEEVWYYPRLTGFRGLSVKHPYITFSRRNKTLLQRLADTEAPVLFEGIHSSYYANDPLLKERTKILRAHNVEHEYYRQLASKATNPLSKLYFKAEAFLLDSYEKSLSDIQTILCLSKEDQKSLKKIHPAATVDFVAPFHPFDIHDIPTGTGHYCLYHGNLSHPENIDAALFLLNEVFKELSSVQFILAGKNPAKTIKRRCSETSNCTLIENPDEATMLRLIKDAHINLLPTFQRSGMKLKLLYALFHGRHVIANNNMLFGTDLENICSVANTPQEMQQFITTLLTKPFDEALRTERAVLLNKHYSNRKNAQKIITYLQQKSL